MSHVARHKKAVLFSLLVALAVGAAWAARTVEAKYPWAWAYVADRLQPGPAQAAAGPTHVMFTFADHFEPHDQATMDRWLPAYRQMASQYRDADGRMPQHSWFWFFSHSDEPESLSFLQQLAGMVYDGFGEVELHFHHGSDTEPTWRRKMDRMIKLSQSTGALVTAERQPRTAFGFIHGMWALDNSRGTHCGVNNEIALLRDLGCYADFTHPSWGPMHPATVNRLYYVADDPARPKSYDAGPRMRVGGEAAGDLLIFEGPSVVRFRRFRPVYDHGDVTMEDQPTPERIDAWVRTGVHVQGRPEWVFVKVFTHSAVQRDHEAVLGEWGHRLHRYLGERYNDGENYVLHYVTAREAYNIAKAAEAGMTGDPNDYRDFLIPPYVNRHFTASAPFEVLSAGEGQWRIRFEAEAGSEVVVRMKGPAVEVAEGAEVLESSEEREGTVLKLRLTGTSDVSFVIGT